MGCKVPRNVDLEQLRQLIALFVSKNLLERWRWFFSKLSYCLKFQMRCGRLYQENTWTLLAYHWVNHWYTGVMPIIAHTTVKMCATYYRSFAFEKTESKADSIRVRPIQVMADSHVLGLTTHNSHFKVPIDCYI